MMFIRRRFPIAATLLILGVSLFFLGSAEAADAESAPADQPISITADMMEADDAKKMILFTGNVVTKQEDILLTCDEMRVYYRPVDPDAGGDDQNQLGGETEIDYIEASGNVKITRGDQVAEAQNALYEAQKKPRTIILTGEPRVWRDKDYLTGKRIVYYLDQNRSVVEGGPKQRVNAVFYQNPVQAAPGQEEAAGSQ
jgi:lipopolysaccharide export system protein LptA